MRFWLILWLWCSPLLVWAQSVEIPAAITQMIHEYGVAQEDLSLVVQAVDAERPLVMINAHEQRNPASVAKLLTTSAALIRMGDDYRWQTRFYVDNLPDAGGVVNGNLYIKGGGDPFLVEERLLAMLQALRSKGIRHITGNIVLDNSMYQLTQSERDSALFDGNATQAYNAVPDPLMVNFRTIKLLLSPGEKDDLVIEIEPKIYNWKIDNQIDVSNVNCAKGYAPVANLDRDSSGYATLHLTGHYSKQCGTKELVAVLGEASEQFYYLFREQWYALGGSFDGGGQLAMTPSTAKLIYVGESLPLSELITKMNQHSNNVMTRQLLLTLGVHLYGEPGSLDKGRQAVLQTLQAFGLDTKGIIIDNGAGLSRVTRVSAAQLAMLLRSLYYSDKAKTFMKSLAVAGESGTLRKRFRGEVIAGQVIGKTGTIDHVRGFAGYVRAESGRNYVVVILGNGATAVKTRYMQDDLLRWVYQQ